MELLGDILSYHQSFPADIPHSCQLHHRMAYTGTAIFTVKLLQTILPPEKVRVCAPVTKSQNFPHGFLWLFPLNSKEQRKIKFLNLTQASDNLPENTATAIFHLCLDTSFGSLLPSMQETAVAYLEQVNSDSHDLYRRVTRAALWMESTCNFLKEVQAEVWAACHIITVNTSNSAAIFYIHITYSFFI